MKKQSPSLLMLLFLLCWGYQLPAQLTLAIDAIPTGTPLGDSLFVAGNLNGWDPGASAFQLTRKSNGHYFLTLNGSLPNPLEYKFTRGSWATVEGDANGNYRPNRVLNLGSADTVWHQVLSWEDVGGNSTANNHVSLLADSFYIPQLSRYRRIWLYLPGDYASSDKHYPVLYMHDGQNLFDVTTSFAGEWEVDETLARLEQAGDYGAIVVGIDNGGTERINEYCPYIHPTYGGGEAAEYGEFLVQNLKPYIDSTYRTLPGREYTALIGSSLGGLVSMYLGLTHQEVFGKIGVFSPAFWINPQLYDYVDTMGHRLDLRVYFLAGQQESVSMVLDMQNMYNRLVQEGFPASELAFEIRADGQHSEWFWAREFGDAYQWLFAGTALDLPDLNWSGLQIYPNPATDHLWVETSEAVHLELWDLHGHCIQQWDIQGDTNLKLDLVPEGMYLLRMKTNEKVGWQKIWRY